MKSRNRNFMLKGKNMKYKNIVLPNYEHCILGTITSILKYYNVKTNNVFSFRWIGRTYFK